MDTTYIKRKKLEDDIAICLDEAPVTVLLGARQTGKTTLAQYITSDIDNVHVFDLEQTTSRNALATPELTLSDLSGTVVIDEVQKIPEIFAILRPLSDRRPNPARFLLLGSASPDLMKGVSESLAGRALFVKVPGFSLAEVGAAAQNSLWLRGGFPRAFLSESETAGRRWRNAFIQTFLERDVPQLGIQIPSSTLNRFWTMVAHYHGQTWNGSEIARSIGVSSPTARSYLDILNGAFVVRVLPPWYENVGKRQTKSPKVYVRDSGILHSLLGIDTMKDLRSHPKYGASWEGFALEQILAYCGDGNAYFWRTQQGAELDLLLFRKGRRVGFEFKCTDAPRMSKSMHITCADLSLDALYVVYPGTETYPLADRVMAMPLVDVPELVEELRLQAD